MLYALFLFLGTPTFGNDFGKSQKTCAELGWSDEIKSGSGRYDGGLGVEGVCGTKDNDNCGKAAEWAEADKKCTDIGARLCTQAEYEALEAGNSGCNLEKKGRYAFTSSTCGEGGRMSIKLTEEGEVTERCREAGEKAYGGRCCADVGEAEATESPTMSPTPEETMSPTPEETMSPTPDESLSEKTCAEMGWSDDVITGGVGVEGVCGTKPEESVCGGELSMLHADAICTDMGARLCTQEEYEALEAFNSGCKIEKKSRAVWTSTGCTESGGDKRQGAITVVLNQKGEATSECTVYEDTAYGGRCCADVGEVVDTDAPSMMPTVAETDAPSMMPTVAETDAPTMMPTQTDAPSMMPTQMPTQTDPPSLMPTQAPVTASPTLPPTNPPTMTNAPTMMPSTSPTDDPDDIDEIMAELLCIAASGSKSACKAALPKSVGKCKWNKNHTLEDRCQLRVFYGNCEDLSRKDCHKAVGFGKCEFVDDRERLCQTPL